MNISRPKIKVLSTFDTEFEPLINLAIEDNYLIQGGFVFNVVEGRVKISCILISKEHVEATARINNLANLNHKIRQ